MRYAQASDHVVVHRYTGLTSLVHLVVDTETAGGLGWTVCRMGVRTDRPDPEECDEIVSVPVTCLWCATNTSRYA